MIQTFTHLHLCVLDREQHERTCGYWYTVTTGALAHTAFRTRVALERWLAERGLELTEPLTEPGAFSHQAIAGAYRAEMHLHAPELEAWKALADSPALVGLARTLSNGDYVEARITEDEIAQPEEPEGDPRCARPVPGDWHAAGKLGRIRTVHTLNPNVRGRAVFDHAASRALEDGEASGADHVLFTCPDGFACPAIGCGPGFRWRMRERDERIVPINTTPAGAR